VTHSRGRQRIRAHSDEKSKRSTAAGSACPPVRPSGWSWDSAGRPAWCRVEFGHLRRIRNVTECTGPPTSSMNSTPPLSSFCRHFCRSGTPPVSSLAPLVSSNCEEAGRESGGRTARVNLWHADALEREPHYLGTAVLLPAVGATQAMHPAANQSERGAGRSEPPQARTSASGVTPISLRYVA
jgi:hypothetical protein